MSVPEGHLPVYSVDTEKQAKTLIAATCPLSVFGEYVAPELVEAQTIENLTEFSDRLHEVALRLGFA